LEQAGSRTSTNRDARAALAKAGTAEKAADLAVQEAVRDRNRRLEQGEPITPEDLVAFDRLVASWHAACAERRRLQREYALFQTSGKGG
jgi:hypothetical protein